MQLQDYNKVESSNIDFKEKVEYAKPKSWLKSVSVFANSNAGLFLSDQGFLTQSRIFCTR